MCKAYSRLLEYLRSRTQQQMLSCASDYERNKKLNFHKEMIVAAKEKMLRDGNLSGAKKLANEHVAAKKSKLHILYPDLSQRIRDCVKAWNLSDKKAEDLKRFLRIYEAAKKTGKVTPAEYTHCLQHTVMTASIINANRKQAIESLKNSDFRAAKKVYQDSEGGELLAEGGDFYGKYVELMPSSGASKTGNPVTIFFNPPLLDLMNMLRDLASWFFVGELKAQVKIS